MDFDDLRHFQPHWNPCHGGGYIHAAYADAQHSNRAAMGGMAVTPHADFTRHTEPCHMNRVTYAISRPRQIDTILPRHRLEVDVVVRSHAVYIQQIVIQIADTALGAYPVKPNSLKSQIGHHGVDIVGKGLIYFDENLFSRN